MAPTFQHQKVQSGSSQCGHIFFIHDGHHVSWPYKTSQDLGPEASLALGPLLPPQRGVGRGIKWTLKLDKTETCLVCFPWTCLVCFPVGSCGFPGHDGHCCLTLLHTYKYLWVGEEK